MNTLCCFYYKEKFLAFSDHLGLFWTTYLPTFSCRRSLSMPPDWIYVSLAKHQYALHYQNYDLLACCLKTKIRHLGICHLMIMYFNTFLLLQVTNLIPHTMAHQHTRSARPITRPSIRPSTNTRMSKNVMTSQRKSVNTWKKRYLRPISLHSIFEFWISEFISNLEKNQV